MKRILISILFIFALLLFGCGTNNISVRRASDTTLSQGFYTYSNYSGPYVSLSPDTALVYASTESQRKAATALQYVVNNELERAADLICDALIEKDTLEWL